MTRIGSSVRRIDVRIPGSALPLMSVSQTRGVIRRTELTDKPPRAESLDVYKICRAGDIVFNKMSIRAGALGVAAEDGLVTYHYEVMRPLPNNDARFIVYLMKSPAFIAELVARERGIGSGDQTNVRTTEVPFSVLKTIDAFIPTLEEQIAIADFLDVETGKIDSLVNKQEQLIAALRERRSVSVDLILNQHGFVAPCSLSHLESASAPEGWRIIHLGTALRQLTNGFVGPTRDILVDEGVPYVQSTHIKQGRIEFNRRPFYVRREWHDQRPRIHLRQGDVLIVQTGDIGKVAVVPKGFGEASCHALQIARVKPEILTGEYLGTFLGSWIGYHYLCSLATGALHPHLEGGIRAVPVVVPPLDVQAVIVGEVAEKTAKIDELIAVATKMIEVLQEYRSALITDAVTGKMDVRGAA